MGLARWNHRETVLKSSDAAVEQHRPLDLDHFIDRTIEIARLGHLQSDATEGIGELDEVRQRFGVGMRQPVSVQQLLPLAHHAHILIVQNENLDRQFVLNRARHFLHGHLHRGIASDIDHQRIRMRHLHAERRRQAVAHGAEAAGGHPVVWFFEAEELRGPHLMLTDFGRDVSVLASGQFKQPLDRILRHDDVVVLPVRQRIARAPAADLEPPRIDLRCFRLGLEHCQQVGKHIGDVADDRHIDADVLVDRRRIDVDVDLLRVRRERVGAAGDAVVEPRTDAQHHVAIVHRHIGFVGAVHAEHTEPVLARGRIRAEAHQRRCDREARHLNQFAQQFRCFRTGIDHAAAAVDHGTARRREQRHGLADLRRIAFYARVIGNMHVRLARRMIGAGRELHILRHVHHNRTRTARGRDVERFVQHLRQIVDVAHQPVVLGAGACDADGVAFLERVIADQMGRHLPGDADQRDRVHQRIGQRGHHVGRAGPRGDECHARLSGRARIALRSMARALLVTHQDVLDIALLENLVIDRKHRAARIPEDVLDPVVLERTHDHRRAGHLVGVVWLAVTHGSLRAPWRCLHPSSVAHRPDGPGHARQ